jgi:hypothetical protein
MKIYRFLLLFLIPILTGCANLQMVNVRPEWNPSKGQEWADANCKAQAQASSRDWTDVVLHNEEKVYYGCMASYGYELRDVPRTPSSSSSNK